MTRLTGIKAITLDVDGTLWDFDGVMRNGLGETLRWRGTTPRRRRCWTSRR